MKIVVSGASGLIGSAVVERLSRASEGGPHQIARLVRRPGAGSGAEIPWSPAEHRLDPAALEGVDAVIHLAGESVASGRWTAEKKARIHDSRVQGTRLLCQTLARLSRPPRVLLSASAIGYYGDRSDEELDETSSPGSGFLAQVCRDWEAATGPATEAGIRTVRMRLGVVLSRRGGALAQMLPLFRLGLGGRLGHGRQYISWITLEDAVEAIVFLLTAMIDGPVNLVAPEPITNQRSTQALGQAVHRPALLPAPAFVLRLALGEVADEMLLSSTRALPRRLAESGFQFGDRTIEAALNRVLNEGGIR